MTTSDDFIKNSEEVISSPEAISLTGYTRSHIAHLSRSKKIDAKLVDNLWYINKESLLNFVKEEERRKEMRKAELAEKRKVEYNNKMTEGYISSPKAISLTGYTRNHISHLSRSKKIDAKLVDNLWYINKESLLNFVKEEEERTALRKFELAKQRRTEYRNDKKEAKRKVHEAFTRKFLESTAVVMVALLFVLGIFNLDAHNFVVKDSVNSIKQVTSPASVYSTIRNLPENFGIGIYNTKVLITRFLERTGKERVQTEAESIPEGFIKTETIITGIVKDNIVSPEIRQPITNIVVTGISQDQLNKALDERSKQIIEHVQAISNINKGGVINNYTTIAHTNKIDMLGDVAISGSTITSSTITGTNISGGTGSFSALSVGGTATSSFSGNISSANLAVTGLASCDTIDTDANGYLTCGTDDSGGTSFGKTWEINANGLLAPTTTIAVHLPGTLFASSSASFDGTVTADNFMGTSTATSTLSGGLSATRLNTTATSTLVGLQVTGGFNIGTITGFLKATSGVVATALVDLASDITGILGVSNGGTGQSNIQANTILLGNGTGAISTTTTGSNGQVLALEGGIPIWVATTTLSNISGTLAVSNGGTGAATLDNLITLGTHSTGNYLATLADAGGLTVANSGSESAAVTVALDLTNANSWTGLQSFANASTTLLSVFNTAYFGGTATSTFNSAGVLTLTSALAETSGGTGQSTYSTGDILYSDSSNSLAKLAIGSNGEVLKLAGGVPTWSTDLTSGGGGGSSFWATTTNDQAVHPADSTDIVIVGDTATTTHNEILQVTGSSYFSGNIFASSSLRVDNSILGNIFTASSTSATSTFAGGLTVQTDALVVQTSSKNVGIGTTSPFRPLSVAGTGVITGELSLPSTSTTDGLLIANQWRLAYLNSAIIQIADNVNDATTFQVGKNDDNAGTISVAGEGAGEGTSGGRFRISTAADHDTTITGFDISASADDLIFNDSSNATHYITFKDSTELIINNNADNLDFRVETEGDTHALFVDAGLNNVGIGTSSPYAKLSVVGEVVSEYFTATSTTATSTFAGGFAVETNGLVYDYSTNNVGIGTASPLHELEVFQSIAADLYIHTNRETTGDLASLRFGTVNSATTRAKGAIFFQADGSGNGRGDMIFAVDSGADSGSAGVDDAVLTIKNGGNVGIGTTTPDAKLEVRYPGNAGTSEYSFKTYGYDPDSYFGVSSDANNSANITLYSSSGTKKFEVLGHTGNTYISGNVGIGTTSPAAALGVEGGIYTTGGVIVGDGTGKLTVGTIDPVYNIGDANYSTYVSGMIGQKEETTGSVTINTLAVDSNGNEGYVYEIDFDEQETGSDLWLFAKASTIRKHIDKLVVLLTPEGGADVWYVIDEAENKVIFLSNTPTKVSYRFTSPRFDTDTWTNYNSDGITGFEVPEFDETVYFENENIEFSFAEVGVNIQQFFITIGGTVVNDVLHLTELVVDLLRVDSLMALIIKTDDLTVGSVEKPTGFTIYDKVTNQPVCIEAVNGELIPTPGECGTQPTAIEGVDTEAPVLTLIGNNPAEIEINSEYSDLGVTVTDNINENIGHVIEVNGVLVESVDLNTGTSTIYTITYSATDEAGNIGSVTREVIVGVQEVIIEEEIIEEEVDEIAPLLTLIGEELVIIEVGTLYIEDGATAEDDIDGDISDNVVITGDVDTDLVGEYSIQYNVSDASENQATEVVRKVIVIEVPEVATSTPETL